MNWALEQRWLRDLLGVTPPVYKAVSLCKCKSGTALPFLQWTRPAESEKVILLTVVLSKCHEGNVTYSVVLSGIKGLLYRWQKTNRSYHCHLYLWGSVIYPNPNNDKKHKYKESHTPSLRQLCLPSLIPSIYILWPTPNFCDSWDTLCLFFPLWMWVVCSLRQKWLYPVVHLTPYSLCRIQFY